MIFIDEDSKLHTFRIFKFKFKATFIPRVKMSCLRISV